MEDDLRKLRVRFQRALLGLLRTDDRNAEFLALEDTLRALGALSERPDAVKVWDRCQSWLESLRTSQQRPKPGYIRYLRMVDQSLKVWLDSGQGPFEREEIPRLLAELERLVEDSDDAAEVNASPSAEDSLAAGQGRRQYDRERADEPGGAGIEEPAPEEIRSVLSGLAAHPVWSAAESLGDGRREPPPGEAAEADASPGKRPAALRDPKDRVPFSNLLPRLDRIVMQAGRDLAKPVRLNLREGGYVDRDVLKKLLLPLEHIVRNAIYHGIEAAEERIRAAKPRTGEIDVTLHRSDAKPRLEIETDGLAIDFGRLRRKAEQTGLAAPDADPTREALLGCLLVTGFSTAHSATQMAGYGIGLDVAKAAVEALGGRLEIRAKNGASLCFVLQLPPGCCGPPELNPV